MKKEVLLDQMVDMMSTITEATIRTEREYYWYDVSSGRIDSEMLAVARKAMNELDMEESDFLAKLTNKIYAVRTFNDNNQIVLTAFLTAPSRKVTRAQVNQANSKKSKKKPSFTHGRPVRLGSLSIDIVPDKTKVSWLQVREPADRNYENKVLKKLKKQFLDLGISSSNPSTISINGIQYQNVVGIYSGKRGVKADFVLKTKRGKKLKVIKGSGISYKKLGFERYAGIARSSDQYNQTVDESISNRFLDLVKANWQKQMVLGNKPSGFVSKESIPNQELVYLIYGTHEIGEPGNWRTGGVSNSEEHAMHLMIGDLNLVESPEGGFTLTSHFTYKHGEIPSGDLNPVLYSRIGKGGSKVNIQGMELPGLGSVPVSADGKIEVRIYLSPENRTSSFIEI